MKAISPAIDVRDRNPIALSSKCQRSGFADAVRASGDDDDLR
jgi:hypothetical protein